MFTDRETEAGKRAKALQGPVPSVGKAEMGAGYHGLDLGFANVAILFLTGRARQTLTPRRMRETQLQAAPGWSRPFCIPGGSHPPAASQGGRWQAHRRGCAQQRRSRQVPGACRSVLVAQGLGAATGTAKQQWAAGADF